MVQSAITSKLSVGGNRRSFGSCLTLLIVVSLLASGAYAQGGAALAPIEKKLFFKTYDSDSDDARLSRIENNLFGQTMQGSFQERMSRITEAAAPKENPDGSMSGLGSQQSPSTAPSAPSAADLKRQAEEEKQAAMERARVAVQAAKEEQANKQIETGVSLWRAKRSTEALQYFEQALKTDPRNASALYYVGIVYESKKNYVEALASYRKAANEDPGNQEYADAVMAVQKLMNSKPAVDPKQAEISKLATEAGDAYKRGEYLSALDLYKQLDQKAPNQALVKYNLGTLYLQAKHYQDALDQFALAVKLRPSDPKFKQAYQQLKANMDKSDAEEKQSEAAWAGRPEMNGGAPNMPNGMNNGMPGNNMQNGNMSGNGGMTGYNGMQGMPGNGMAGNNMRTNNGMGMPNNGMNNGGMQGYTGMQNNGMPNNNGMNGMNGMPNNGMSNSMNNGMNNSGMPNNGFPANNGANNMQGNNNSMQHGSQKPQQASRPVATLPGTGREPGLAPTDNGSSSLNKWAQTQTASRPDMSDIPPGQHPLIRHPLHSAGKPAPNLASNTPSTPLPFQPEKPIAFAPLQQPSANAINELGIEAANTKSGVTITHVGIASRASKAGLLKGDLIRAVDNKVVSNLSQVMSIVSKKGSGAPVDLHIQRKDQMGIVHL